MILLQQAIEAGTFQWFDKVSPKFFFRFIIDIVAVTILIRFIYYRHYKRTDLFLTFFGFNVIIFLITYLLNKVEMSMGAAFGLFAVFSILRYRTEPISTKDMTYLFLVIALGLITAISKGSWDDISIMALILLGSIALLEGNWIMKSEVAKTIIYDKIELIKPEKGPELLADLKERTGLDIKRVEVQNLDFLKDAATVIIYYHQV